MVSATERAFSVDCIDTALAIGAETVLIPPEGAVASQPSRIIETILESVSFVWHCDYKG